MKLNNSWGREGTMQKQAYKVVKQRDLRTVTPSVLSRDPVQAGS